MWMIWIHGTCLLRWTILAWCLWFKSLRAHCQPLCCLWWMVKFFTRHYRLMDVKCFLNLQKKKVSSIWHTIPCSIWMLISPIALPLAAELVVHINSPEIEAQLIQVREYLCVYKNNNVSHKKIIHLGIVLLSLKLYLTLLQSLQHFGYKQMLYICIMNVSGPLLYSSYLPWTVPISL